MIKMSVRKSQLLVPPWKRISLYVWHVIKHLQWQIVTKKTYPGRAQGPFCKTLFSLWAYYLSSDYQRSWVNLILCHKWNNFSSFSEIHWWHFSTRTWQAGQGQPPCRFLPAPAPAPAPAHFPAPVLAPDLTPAFASAPAPAIWYLKKFMTQQKRRTNLMTLTKLMHYDMWINLFWMHLERWGWKLKRRHWFRERRINHEEGCK